MFQPFMPMGMPSYVRADRVAQNQAAREMQTAAALKQLVDLYTLSQTRMEEQDELDAFRQLGLGRSLTADPSREPAAVPSMESMASGTRQAADMMTREGRSASPRPELPATRGASYNPKAKPLPYPEPISMGPDGLLHEEIEVRAPTALPYTGRPMMGGPARGPAPSGDDALRMRRAESRVLQKMAPHLTQMQVVRESARGRQNIQDQRTQADMVKLQVREGRKLADRAEQEAMLIRKDQRKLSLTLRSKGINALADAAKLAKQTQQAIAAAESNLAKMETALADDADIERVRQRISDLQEMLRTQEFIVQELTERSRKRQGISSPK